MTVHFKESLFLLFAERNLTDNMLKRSDVNYRIRLDMLQSLDTSLNRFYLFKISLDSCASPLIPLHKHGNYTSHLAFKYLHEMLPIQASVNMAA